MAANLNGILFYFRTVLDIGGISGMVWIHLLAGRGLRMTPEGTQITPQPAIRDLYCVLECDRVHKARTVVRSGDLQFDWDESFELDLVSNKQLDVLVYSWDPQHRHKLCYRGAVSLSLLRQSPMHQLALKVHTLVYELSTLIIETNTNTSISLIGGTQGYHLFATPLHRSTHALS